MGVPSAPNWVSLGPLTNLSHIINAVVQKANNKSPDSVQKLPGSLSSLAQSQLSYTKSARCRPVGHYYCSIRRHCGFRSSGPESGPRARKMRIRLLKHRNPTLYAALPCPTWTFLTTHCDLLTFLENKNPYLLPEGMAENAEIFNIYTSVREANIAVKAKAALIGRDEGLHSVVKEMGTMVKLRAYPVPSNH